MVLVEISFIPSVSTASLRLPVKTADHFAVSPLQNGLASLDSVLVSGLFDLKGGAYRALQAGTPSGTRTLDTLIKSQVLYQLS